MSIGKSLSALMKSRKVTLEEIATTLNVTRQAVSRWKNDKADPSVDKLLLLAKFFNLPLTAFFQGMESVESCIPEEEDKVPDGFVAIPEYKFRVAAGDDDNSPDWEEIETPRMRYYSLEFFKNRGLDPAKCARTTAIGDSMLPDIKNGDSILFEFDEYCTLQNITDGEVYVISVDGSMRVKRLATSKGRLIVKSDNPEYETEIYEGEELNRVKIYGAVYEVTHNY